MEDCTGIKRTSLSREGRADLKNVSSIPRLRGGNAELYDVKVFDGSEPWPGKLLRTIPKKELVSAADPLA